MKVLLILAGFVIILALILGWLFDLTKHYWSKGRRQRHNKSHKSRRGKRHGDRKHKSKRFYSDEEDEEDSSSWE